MRACVRGACVCTVREPAVVPAAEADGLEVLVQIVRHAVIVKRQLLSDLHGQSVTVRAVHTHACIRMHVDKALSNSTECER